MTKRILSALLIAVLLITPCLALSVPTEKEAYEKIISMKSQYPEGRAWNNSHYYSWKGGTYGASACMGFAMLLSDAAFDSLPARDIKATASRKIQISDLHVGDILRLPGHSVIVLETHPDHIIIAEGNWERRVHWGRKITAAQVSRAQYYTTRYPESTVFPKKDAVEIVLDGKTVYFEDIADHWARENIIACVLSGMISGVGEDTCFNYFPDRVATRAELASILYRAKGSPEVKSEASFSDITVDWMKKPVSFVTESGIMSGTGESTFSPNTPVTREMLAVCLYRYAQAKTEDITALSAFPDSEEVAPYAGEALAWAIENEIIGGKNGKLAPCDNTTRAELATVLVRFSNVLLNRSK